MKSALRVLVCTALTLALTGCFISDSLFDRERIWDPSWFGRYEAEGVTFVVLPDDPAQRTYLLGEFDNGGTKVDSYRVALYRGWSNAFILGHVLLGRAETRPTYTILHPIAGNRFVSQWPDCNADFAARHGLTRDHDVCSFASLESLRVALKAFADEKPPSSDGPKPVERRRDHPLSTIGIMARAGVFTDSEGVHGGLKLIDVPPASPAAKAGLKKGDEIFAVGDPRPAIGEELLLRIAAAKPGTTLTITFFDGKTRAKRQLAVVTAALE